MELAEFNICVSVSGTLSTISTPSALTCQERPQHQHSKSRKVWRQGEGKGKDALSLMPSSADGFDKELKLTDSMNLATSQNSSMGDLYTTSQIFSCKYCQRKFCSSQALGGHQNAHKRERSLVRRNQNRGATISATTSATTPFKHPYFHQHNYTNISFPPLDDPVTRSLAMQVDSITQNPSYMTLISSSRNTYGRQGYSRLPIEQQPAMRKQVEENYIASTAPGPSSRVNVGQFDTAYGGVGRSTGSPVQNNQGNLKKLDLSLKL